MGYQAQLKESDMKILQPLIDEIEALGEGEGLRISHPPEIIDWVRSRLYAHFDIGGQQGVFTIKRETEETLAIIRQSTFVAATDLLSTLGHFLPPRTKARRTIPGFQGSSSRAAPTESPGITFYNQHAGSTASKEEYIKLLQESGLSANEIIVSLDKWRQRKPAEEAQEAQPPAAGPGGKPPRVHATGPGMEFTRDHLLMEEDQEAAVKALREEGLSPEDQAVGLSEWKRINNKE